LPAAALFSIVNVHDSPALIPSKVENRKAAEKAITGAIQQAYLDALNNFSLVKNP